MIRRVFIRAREQFGVEKTDINMTKPDMKMIEVNFNLNKKAKKREIFLFLGYVI
jgi:hypothetical protein